MVAISSAQRREPVSTKGQTEKSGRPTRKSVSPPIPDIVNGGRADPSGADLTFATQQATISQSERQIQSSTRTNVLLVVL
jgi:hypothetical protein